MKSPQTHPSFDLHRHPRRRPGWSAVFAALSLWLLGAGMAPAFTPTNAAEGWQAYKQAFYYVINGNEGYFREREGVGNTVGTYLFAYAIEGAIDAKDVTVVNNTLVGLKAHLTHLYGAFPAPANPAEDDNIEFTLVLVRAYQLTGDVSYLNYSKSYFDMVYNRSWDTAGGGGLYRWHTSDPNDPHRVKSAQVNAPASLAAYLIYASGGGSAYLTKSQAIYSWMLANGLWNSTTGQVNPTPGDTNNPLSSDEAYFAAASYYLGYGANATKAGDFLQNKWGTGLQGFGPGSPLGPVNGINLRWLGKIGDDPVFLRACVDRGLSCTNSRGLVGVDFRGTTSEAAQYASDCSNIVAGLKNVTPIPQAYAIFSRSTGMALTASNGGRTNGTPLVQSTYAGAGHQLWQINPLGNGQYAAIGTASGRAMNVSSASQSDNAQVELWSWANVGNEKYTLVNQGGGFYNVVFVHSGKAMEVLNNSTASGASIVQYTAGAHGYNAQWRFQPVVSPGVWVVAARSTGKALDAEGAGTARATPLIQDGYHGGTNQQWTINSLGSWQYNAIGVGSGRAMNVSSGSQSDNAQVELWDWANVGNQKFTVVDSSSGAGYDHLVFVHSGKALQVKYNSSADGAPVVQYTLDANGYNQQWSFQAP